MTSAILYHERLVFLARGPALAAIALLVATILYAGWSGDTWRDNQGASLVAYEANTLKKLDGWRTQLADIELGKVEASSFDANPMSISFPATLPPSSLNDFAIGHADLHPASAEVSPWRNVSSVFGRYQFDNPTMLASSTFDVAFVIVFLLPIAMIAMSFDVISSERQRGSLAMVLVSPVSLQRVVWTRLAFRNGVLWLAAAAAMLVLALLNDTGGDRFARFGLWLGASFAYGLSWFAIIGLCVAYFRSAVATAGALLGTWVLFSVVLPATVSTIAESAFPTPSRLAYLSDIREAQGETNRNLADLTAGFLMDHPDLTVGDDNIPAYMRAAFLSNEAARESTRPVMERYDAARQGRARTVSWAQFLSPSIITHRVLLLAAGGDLERQHAYQSQVLDALDTLSNALGPAIVSRNRITLYQFDALQAFTFADVSAGTITRRATAPIVFLLVISFVLGGLAHRRLSRDRFA